MNIPLLLLTLTILFGLSLDAMEPDKSPQLAPTEITVSKAEVKAHSRSSTLAYCAYLANPQGAQPSYLHLLPVELRNLTIDRLQCSLNPNEYLKNKKKALESELQVSIAKDKTDTSKIMEKISTLENQIQRLRQDANELRRLVATNDNNGLMEKLKIVNANIQGSLGGTALDKALQTQNNEAVLILINNYTNIDTAFGSHKDALHESIREKNYPMFELLLDCGADINGNNDLNNTPLHYAVYNDAIECAKLLIQKGALLNQQNNYGDTPLHYAAIHGNSYLITILLDAGANPNLKNHYQKMPIEVLVGPKEGPIRTLLKQAINKNNVHISRDYSYE